MWVGPVSERLCFPTKKLALNPISTDVQCKSKWKAMRDQYCRELKRAKACSKAVKWKYFKELDFLRPYALARK